MSLLAQSTNSSGLELADFNDTICDVPLSVLGPSYELASADFDPELLWPCQVRQYWLLLQPFVNFVRALLTYVTSFIIVSGVALNILSFVLLRTPIFNDSNLPLHLKALAISDSGALIFNYATNIARSQSSSFNKLFMNSKFLCAMNSVTMELFQFTSTWLIACLTWTRLYAVTFPLKKLINHCNSAMASVVALAIISLTVSLTKLYFAGYESDSVFEFVPCHKKAKAWGSTMHLYIALSTWLPLIFIFFGNVLLIVNMKKTEKIRNQLTQNPVYKMNQTFRTNRTLLVVSLVHLILLLPLGIVETIELYWDVVLVKYPSGNKQEQELYIHWLQEKLLLKWCRGFFFHLYHWNFAINFFLYYLTGTKFRNNVLEVLKRWKYYFKCSEELKIVKTSKVFLIHVFTMNEHLNTNKESISKFERYVKRN